MKAEDTVIPVEERIKMGVWHGREKQAQAQAEVSFKAGIQEVVEWVKTNHGYIGLCLPNSFLSWIQIDPAKWQAKLKEWGIK